MGETELSLKAMVRVFRRECHRVLESERTTVHGADNMLMVLQLVTAEVRKQERGEFAVALSDVLAAWNCLLLDKLHLSHTSCPFPECYDLIRKEYDSFLRRTNTVDLIDVYGMYKQLKRAEDSEDPLTATQLFEFLRGSTETLEAKKLDPTCPATPSNKAPLCSSQIRRVFRRFFCSYLSLLVNAKNDLAVGLVLCASGSALGHMAFTDLKHAARQSSTSLFLAATAFVRAIQLGGKGYAPSETDPLRKHVKSLFQFVHFTDQLEEILEETSEPSAAGDKILSSVRAALLKSLSHGNAAKAMATEAADGLKERVHQLWTIHKDAGSSSGVSPARPRAYAINHATAYEGRETVKLLMALLDEEAIAPPCRNKAELLTEDQAILDGTEGMCLLTLFRSPEVPTGLSPKPLKNRIQGQQEHVKSKVRQRVIRSQFACTYLDNDPPLNRVLEFPSTNHRPTCVRSAPTHGSSSPVATPRHEGHKPSDACNILSVEAEPEPPGSTPRGSGLKAAPLRQDSATGGAGEQLAAIQTGSETTKRKLATGEGADEWGKENQPPSKRPAAISLSSQPGKSKRRAAPRKLIAGQGKLTSFFRL